MFNFDIEFCEGFILINKHTAQSNHVFVVCCCQWSLDYVYIILMHALSGLVIVNKMLINTPNQPLNTTQYNGIRFCYEVIYSSHVNPRQ